jgi:hypothetical protein
LRIAPNLASARLFIQNLTPIDKTIDWFLSLAASRRKTNGAVWLFAGLILLLIVPTVSPGQTASAKPCERDQSPPMFSVAGTSEELARAFLVALQKAVASDDRRKVASMIRYPIVIWARDRNVRFKTPASLAASYELIFTAAIKKTIAEARTECLFTNWKGVMIHDGEIWMGAGSKGGLQIITINRPVGEERQVKPRPPPPPAFKVHPKVFSLIEPRVRSSAFRRKFVALALETNIPTT